MPESEAHKTLKLIGRALLRLKGYSHLNIDEECTIYPDGDRFRADLVVKRDDGVDGIVAVVECGNCKDTKVQQLEDVYDEVIHLPYGSYGVPEIGNGVEGLKIDIEPVARLKGLKRELTYELLKD